MKTKHTITITVYADETKDKRVDLAEIRESIGRTLSEDYSEFHSQYGYEDVAALLTAINIDGRSWDPERGRLGDYPQYMDDEVITHLREGRKIQAIKQIRVNADAAGEYIGLGDAKALADNWKP